MKLIITVEINDRDAANMSQNAIERVINTSIEILDRSRHGDAHQNAQDWRESKAIVTLLWMRLQDAIYRQQCGLPAQE